MLDVPIPEGVDRGEGEPTGQDYGIGAARETGGGSHPRNRTWSRIRKGEEDSAIGTRRQTLNQIG
jgi:hypothetical protein